MSLGLSYRHLQTGGVGSESRACVDGGHAVSPETEEEASLFPSSPGTEGYPSLYRETKKVE